MAEAAGSVSDQAFVTLTTNDVYALGALTLGHSLRRTGTAHPLVVLVTPEVSQIARQQLANVFNEVREVEPLDSADATHLALLGRPDLGATFTKLRIWTLTHYTKGVFLDADTLVLQPIDELFERDELSAAPDAGWPDCFNSGVFVFRPSLETYEHLVQLALTRGSFDGGDQGILNEFFSGWATSPNTRLSFLYNVVHLSFYSYMPALKRYISGVKILHFIGSLKPWQYVLGTRGPSLQVTSPAGVPAQHHPAFVALWWAFYLEHVHKPLTALPAADVMRDSSSLANLLTRLEALELNQTLLGTLTVDKALENVREVLGAAPPVPGPEGSIVRVATAPGTRAQSSVEAAAAATIASGLSDTAIARAARAAWEAGQVDYGGVFAYQNIQRRIAQSMATSTSVAKAPSPTPPPPPK